jgi:hypothetical protein
VTEPLPKVRARAAFTLQAAWQAAVAVTASAYDVNARVLGSLGRPGRRGGACTPPSYWPARKAAVYVAVLTADCTYAELARLLGLHRDTVTSQCEELRLAVIEDPMLERRLEVLEQRARARLARELLSIFGDLRRAIEQAWTLTEDAIERGSLSARMGEVAAYGRTNPTLPEPGVDATLFTFPRLGSAE